MLMKMTTMMMMKKGKDDGDNNKIKQNFQLLLRPQEKLYNEHRTGMQNVILQF